MGALNKRLGTSPSLGSPRGFVEILHHLNQALAGPRERQAGQDLGSINPVVAPAPLSDLALSALEVWAFFAKNVILLPAHRAWPRVGAASSNLPTKLLFSSLEEDEETGAQRGAITALRWEGGSGIRSQLVWLKGWRVFGHCFRPPP